MLRTKTWYELSEEEKRSEIYHKYSLRDFWTWWHDGSEDTYMEIRIKNYQLIKKISKQLYVPMSKSGVYVNSYEQLLNVINYLNKERVNVWFGINPRRKLVGKRGYSRLSGKDIHIKEIKYLFIDIDRITKNGPAQPNELMSADMLSNSVLEELNKAGFAKNYLKICSGNGIQLLIKLDTPFKMPEPPYSDEINDYYEDELFIDRKEVLLKGISKVLVNFSHKFKDYNVEIDKTSFNIGRVGALPFTYNFKYEEPLMRGIIEIQNQGINEGLSDYLNDLYRDKKFLSKVKYSYNKKDMIIISEEYKVKYNDIRTNNIIQLMLTHEFPDGYINNTLWYCVKILLHANGVDRTNPNYIRVHSILKKIHKRTLNDNGLEPQFRGNYNGPIKQGDINNVALIVNKYLRLHKVKRIKDGKLYYHKPLFPFATRGKQKHDILIELSLDVLKNTDSAKLQKLKSKYSVELIAIDDPLADIKIFSNMIYKLRKEYKNLSKKQKEGLEIKYLLTQKQINDMFLVFFNQFLHKWGAERTVYFYKYYFDCYLNYDIF